MQFWVEKTYVKSRPDRQQGEFAFGSVLWSPQSGSDGRDTYRLMRDVKPGDVVFHFIDKNAIAGVSIISEGCNSNFVGPQGTEWQGRPAYLVRLQNYTKLTPPIGRSEFLDEAKYKANLLEIARTHDSLFFDRNLTLRQGAYLTIAPPRLVSIWDEIYFSKTGNHLPMVDVNFFPSQREAASRGLAEAAQLSLKLDKVKTHLEAFKQEATAWFAKAAFVKDYFDFFHAFFLRENLEKAEWPDIQRIGDHLHCFQSMALAKARAVGKPNHSIEHYRKSFIYLAHGTGEPAERIRRFCNDEEYRILGFGKSAFSELVGYLFPDEFMFVNSRDKFAAEFLGIKVEKQSGDDLVAELEAFSKAMRPVAKLYEEIVGKQTDLPLNLEVDQFLSWLYENNEAEIPAKQLESAAKYSERVPDPASVGDDDTDITPQASIEHYDKSKAMDGLFLAEKQFDEMHDALKEKKNVVLQGAPGVGKTFVAKRLAYALIESNDQRQVEVIQFHQSYSYEDFIQGFRPTPNGHFDLKYGIFYQFCRRAQRDEAAKKPYVFIIDEINRGNLSKIFGELMMLIEPDKRGKEHAIPLAYSQNAGERFYIPENLHLIGMMNTADRSLAMVDYALRRRFRFITLRPEFSSDAFGKFLADAGAAPALAKKIVTRMNALNEVIAADTKNLGPGYQIGHSYFCPRNGIKPDDNWYRRVIESEIVPLIQEYWFDNEQKVKEQRSALLA
jgi:hypothetical protein